MGGVKFLASILIIHNNIYLFEQTLKYKKIFLNGSLINYWSLQKPMAMPDERHSKLIILAKTS